jgi:hypothetical protein
LHIRLVNDSTGIKEILERIIAKRAHIEYLSIAEPVRLLALENFPQELVRFTTDIPHLTNWEAASARPRLDSRRAHHRRAHRQT